MEIEDLTNAFDRAKKLIEEMGEAYQAPDHLQLAREIVKLRKRFANLVSTRFVEKLPDSPKRTRLQHDGCFPHQPP